jgi:hypothetical protein
MTLQVVLTVGSLLEGKRRRLQVESLESISTFKSWAEVNSTKEREKTSSEREEGAVGEQEAGVLTGEWSASDHSTRQSREISGKWW